MKTLLHLHGKWKAFIRVPGRLTNSPYGAIVTSWALLFEDSCSFLWEVFCISFGVVIQHILCNWKAFLLLSLQPLVLCAEVPSAWTAPGSWPGVSAVTSTLRPSFAQFTCGTALTLPVQTALPPSPSAGPLCTGMWLTVPASLALSNCSYHPDDSGTWSVAGMLVGLLCDVETQVLVFMWCQMCSGTASEGQQQKAQHSCSKV